MGNLWGNIGDIEIDENWGENNRTSKNQSEPPKITPKDVVNLLLLCFNHFAGLKAYSVSLAIVGLQDLWRTFHFIVALQRIAEPTEDIHITNKRVCSLRHKQYIMESICQTMHSLYVVRLMFWWRLYELHKLFSKLFSSLSQDFINVSTYRALLLGFWSPFYHRSITQTTFSKYYYNSSL